MVNLTEIIHAIKYKLAPPKKFTTEEGQREVDRHYQGISKDTPEEIERRLNICSACVNKKQYFGLDMCKSCHCFVKLKTALKGTTCPIDKW